MSYVTFNTSEIDHMQTYRLLAGSIVPRPIAWVSSISSDGVANLAPFSFFTCVCHAPPLVSISVGERDYNMKDTSRNIIETKGYVIHTVVNETGNAMNESSANFKPQENEFKELDLETEPSQIVKAPRIKDSPITMECELEHLHTYGDKWKTHLVIGRILLWHVREDLMIDGKYINPEKLEPLGRLGGANYCRTQDIFQMERVYPPPDKVHPNEQTK